MPRDRARSAAGRRPEGVFCGDLVDVGVVDGEQAALFEIGQDDSPASPQVGEGAIEEIGLKALFIVAAHDRKRRLFIPVGEVRNGQPKRPEDSLAQARVGQRLRWRVRQRLVDRRRATARPARSR